MFSPKDNFSSKDPVAKISASWLNGIAAFLKHIQVEIINGRGIIARFTKPDNPSSANPPKITLDFSDAKFSGGNDGAELSDATPLADSGTGSAGTAELASREDHKHPLNAPTANNTGSSGNYSTSPPSLYGNTGNDDEYARADHSHPRQSVPGPAGYAQVPLPDAKQGDMGTGLEYARHDHVHPFSTGYASAEDIITILEMMDGFLTDEDLIDLWLFCEYLENYLFYLDGEISGLGLWVDWEIYDIWDYLLNNMGGGGDLALSNAIPLVDTGTGVSGASPDASRADHRHPLNVDATAPVADSSGSAGAAATYARRDHSHPLNALGANINGTAGNYPTAPNSGLGNTGSRSEYARADHFHPAVGMPGPATSPPLADTTPANIGSSSLYARENHQHPLNVTTSAPPADSSTGSAGNSSQYARANHIHPLSTAYATNQDITQLITDFNTSFNYLLGLIQAGGGGGGVSLSNATPLADGTGTAGNASDASRGNHRHPLNVTSGAPPANSGSGGAGSSAYYARADHYHPDSGGGGGGVSLSNSTPLTDIGTGMAGSSAAASRSDHRHPLCSEYARQQDLTNKYNELVKDINALFLLIEDLEGGGGGGTPSNSTPSPVGATGSAGVSPTVSRSDHVHADKPPVNEASKTTINPATTTLAANTATWTSGASSTGLSIRVKTREYYDSAANPPVLYMYQRDFIYDRFGRLYSVSAEFRTAVNTTTLITWS